MLTAWGQKPQAHVTARLSRLLQDRIRSTDANELTASLQLIMRDGQKLAQPVLQRAHSHSLIVTQVCRPSSGYAEILNSLPA